MNVKEVDGRGVSLNNHWGEDQVSVLLHTEICVDSESTLHNQIKQEGRFERNVTCTVQHLLNFPFNEAVLGNKHEFLQLQGHIEVQHV